MCAKAFNSLYILMNIIRLWAIVLYDVSYLMISCPLLLESEYQPLILPPIQLMFLFIKLEGNIDSTHNVSM